MYSIHLIYNLYLLLNYLFFCILMNFLNLDYSIKKMFLN